MSAESYPLQWPDGWPRTPISGRDDSKYRFKRSGSQQFWTFAAARDALYLELERLNVSSAVISCNFEPNLRGEISDKGRRPDDQGIAVYFMLKGRQLVMASDTHQRAEENMRSIALAIDAMRALDRHGGGVMMERAFNGFAALPNPNQSARSWRDVLGVSHETSFEVVRAAYRAKAKETHPDNGGDAVAFNEVTKAWEEAQRAIGKS